VISIVFCANNPSVPPVSRQKAEISHLWRICRILLCSPSTVYIGQANVHMETESQKAPSMLIFLILYYFNITATRYIFLLPLLVIDCWFKIMFVTKFRNFHDLMGRNAKPPTTTASSKQSTSCM